MYLTGPPKTLHFFIISCNNDSLNIRVQKFAPLSSDFYMYIHVHMFIADPEKCALNIMYAQWVDG